MTMRRILYIFIMYMLVSISGFSSSARSQSSMLIDGLEMQLADARTAADSLKILFDIYDLSRSSDKIAVAQRCYEAAVRAGNITAQLDMLRRQANMIEHDTERVSEMEKIVRDMPPGDEQQETLTFLRLVQTRNSVNDTTEKAEQIRRDRLYRLLDDYYKAEAKGMDNWDKFENIFNTCIYLQHMAPGQLLKDRLLELEKMLPTLPGAHVHLSSIFYDFAVNAYLMSDDQTSALRLSENIMDRLTDIENDFRSSGRIYRNYDLQRYDALWRMMACYETLTLSKIDSIYRDIQALAVRNADVADELADTRRPEIFYLMAHRRYREALDIIEEMYPKADDEIGRDRLLREYVLAARGANDEDALRFALSKYNNLLEQRLQDKLLGSTLKLQCIYNNSKLYEANAELRRKNEQLSTESIKRRTLYAVIGAVALILVILSFYFAYRRAKSHSELLSESNKKLLAERDAVRAAHRTVLLAREKANVADRMKTDFIHDISHEVTEPINAIVGYTQLIVDSVDGERRQVLDRFMNGIKTNADKLQGLVGNVLDRGARNSASDNNGPRMETFDMSDILDKAVFMYRPEIGNHLSSTVVKVTADTSLLMYGDKKLVENAIDDLFKMAIEYSKLMSVAVEYGLEEDGGMIYVRMKFAVEPFGSRAKIDTVKLSEEEIVSSIRSQIDWLHTRIEAMGGSATVVMLSNGHVVLTLHFPALEDNSVE